MSDQNKPLIEEENKKEPMIMPVKVSLAIGAVGFVVALILIIVFASTHGNEDGPSEYSSSL